MSYGKAMADAIVSGFILSIVIAFAAEGALVLVVDRLFCR